MNTNTVVGLQWGDEGKGKITDYLTPQYDYVVRFQGGANAGHTIYLPSGEKRVLHQIPTGILYGHTKCIIGNGCVVNVPELKQEIKALESLGITVKGRLFISDRANVVTEEHLNEDEENKIKFGSTGKGIGPAYRDRVYRSGIRMGEIQDKKLRDFVVDTSEMLYAAGIRGQGILFEGAQGALLDIDYGTYPHVTSCHTLASYAPTGAGVPANFITNVVGVVKAYTTRVGTGPFPTQLHGKIEEELREVGNEYGATTGRPRKVGWLDLVGLKYACRLNGVTELAVTKLDTLCNFETIKIATEYRYNGIWTKTYPEDLSKVDTVKYKEFAGWPSFKQRDSTVRWLPPQAKLYLSYIERELGLPIKLIGTGPGRDDIIENNLSFTEVI